MGIVGQKPKPARLKILTGNPGRREIPIEPTPPPEKPEPPAHLDAYSREEWDRVVEGLYAMGILSSIDQSTLAAYCGAYGRWRAAEEELGKLRAKAPINALVLKTISGNWIQQPLIGISNKAAADMVRYASEFGMTPFARARLAVDPKKGQKSKFDGLIGIKGGKDKK